MRSDLSHGVRSAPKDVSNIRLIRRPLPSFVLVSFLAWGCQVGPSSMPVPTADPPIGAGTGDVVGQVARPPGTAIPIIMLEPRIELEVPVPNEPAEIDQYGRAFVPQLIIVREGQVVRFRNSEYELHNVNVMDEQGVTIFNVGMPILGGTYDHSFDRAGDYAVACNVHQEMAALIVVTSTPFATVADLDGRFTFSGVPHGTYDLVVRRGGDRKVHVIEISDDRTELRLGSS